MILQYRLLNGDLIPTLIEKTAHEECEMLIYNSSGAIILALTFRGVNIRIK